MSGDYTKNSIGSSLPCSHCRILLKNDTEGVEVGYCNIYSSSTQYKTGSLQYREQYT